MINIVRVYNKQVPGTHREYAGRSGKGVVSVLGNPAYQGTRDENCEEFVKYFELMMCETNTSAKAIAIRKRINELVEIAKTQDIELACFCQSPKDVVKKRCHTETIKAYIEQQLEKSKMKTQVNEPIGIIRPVVNQMDCIPSFRNELAFLSNMYECEIESKHYGCIFQNAESAYQAMKNPQYAFNFENIDGYTAKRLGKQAVLRSDWNEVKLSIMEKILRAKFQGELLQKLLAVKVKSPLNVADVPVNAPLSVAAPNVKLP
jgi:hypothetical protein